MPKCNAVDKTFNLKSGWQKRMLTLYRDGATDEEVRRWIQDERGFINDYIFDYWREHNEEFAKIYQMGQILKKAWWMQQGRENLANSRFNTPLYIRMIFAACGIKGEPSKIESYNVNALDLGALDTKDLDTLQKIMEKAAKKESSGEAPNARIAAFRSSKERLIA
jgi:hypothetical protein